MKSYHNKLSDMTKIDSDLYLKVILLKWGASSRWSFGPNYVVTMSTGKTRPTLSKMSPNEFVILAYELLNRQPGLIIEKILIYLENNINSSMRKILGVEGDTDYDKLSLDVICEAKERL